MANNENVHGKEAVLLKKQLKHTQMVCKAIWNYRDYIEEIKDYISKDQPVGAGELWNDLAYNIQKLLITAPTKGGPFTTNERAIIKTLWNVTVDDIEASYKV